jgi:hypothetical protein
MSDHVNNLASRPLNYCCGGTEVGNFNYVDEKEFKATHFHRVGGGWKANPNAKGDPTTMDDLRHLVHSVYSALTIATTGAGQEYMEPLLAEMDFQHVFTFPNPGHANTPVKLWARAKNGVK